MHLRLISSVLSLLTLLAFVAPAAAATVAPAIAPETALRQLADGNARFAAGQARHPRQDSARRTEVAAGQHPFATILTCSDSRLPAETLFDQGLGDLFVVRVAGNVALPAEIGSIDYAIGHLGTPVLLVLGHSRCGAVNAVVENAEVQGNLADLVQPIRPVVARLREAQAKSGPELLLEKAVLANVWNSVETVLRASETVRARVQAGKLAVVGGVYDLVTGVVTVHGAHPGQAAVLAAANPVVGDAAPAPSAKADAPSPAADAPAAHATAARCGYPRWI